MNDRERNRQIIEAWNPNVLAFMDDMKKEFEGDVRVTKLFCEVRHDKDTTDKRLPS